VEVIFLTDTVGELEQQQLPKCLTGIQGLDEITNGGLPRNRTSLVCGSAGCGKTLLAMQFLVNGATLYDEPGVFMSFEENEKELAENVISLGIDLKGLMAEKKIFLDYIYFDKSEITETGDYDLEGLFVRLDYAINFIGAKRVVLDTIEAIFAGLANVNIIRAELRRLFRWLKDRGVTAIVTGEKGAGTLTRHGIEEYVSDCVIQLDHKVSDQISTRRLQIVKYRGSAHGTNEYPFLIDEEGICIMPITSVGLTAQASSERISSGIERLDTMLGGRGYFAGSSILISGTAGTGKTTLAAFSADAACRRGERCLYFVFEESDHQIIRNMRSVGLDLKQWKDNGMLRFVAARPTLLGLEMHLVRIYKMVNEFKPQLVILDPISNLTVAGENAEVKIMLTRLIDFLKLQGITAIFTKLSSHKQMEESNLQTSSLIDTWVTVRDIEINGERNRGIYVLKSRGMSHSNQIREFILSDHGVELVDVYTGADGILTGSARFAQEEKDAAQRLLSQQEIERKQREVERKRTKMEAEIVDLKLAFEADEEELEKLIAEEVAQSGTLANTRKEIAALRKGDK
jgi:circadian clock protein KaiC